MRGHKLAAGMMIAAVHHLHRRPMVMIVTVFMMTAAVEELRVPAPVVMEATGTGIRRYLMLLTPFTLLKIVNDSIGPVQTRKDECFEPRKNQLIAHIAQP